MNTTAKLAALLLGLATLNSQLSTARAQGSLTPPAGVPAPVFKTLSQIEPRTPISTASFTISQPGSYYLTTNLTGVGASPGITIATNDVTLDLSGFAITGPAVTYAGVYVGSGSYTNVTIRNGTIKGWVEGVRILDVNCKNIVLDQLNIADAFGFGIEANGAAITRCTITASGNDGIFARNSHLENTTVDSSRGAVIALYGGSLMNSHVQNCAKDGVFINAAGNQVIGNTFQNNNTTNSATHASIRIQDANNRIENNHISGSGAAGAGIWCTASYSGNVIIRNTVLGGGGTDYTINGSQFVGPIITTTGTITNLNPWANFSN
mgnify:CR=1 FL=1